MSNVKGYRCTNCGKMLPISNAHNKIVTCECCNSQYKIENDYEITPLRIETWHYDSQVVSGQVVIPREYLHGNVDPTALMEMSLTRMANDMAEKLVPLMDICVERDIMSLNYILYGRLRVAVPPSSPNEVLSNALNVDLKPIHAMEDD